jgi:hypothetical protein
VAGHGYTRHISLLTGNAASSSNVTSGAALTADWNIVTLSWQTATASASTLTAQGTLSEGLRADSAAIAEAEWSTLTTLTAQGIFTVDPGARWIRVLRGSPESASTVFLGGRVY